LKNWTAKVGKESRYHPMASKNFGIAGEKSIEKKSF